MALIDAKGRIFGSINVIDAFIIFIGILLILGYVTFAYRAQPTEQIDKLWNITILADHSEIASAVQVGDTEQQQGVTIATVQRVRVASSGVLIESLVRSASSSSSIGKQGPFKPGTPLVFDFPERTVSGVIITAQQHG